MGSVDAVEMEHLDKVEEAGDIAADVPHRGSWSEDR
jgi:hypothetical protein